MPDLTSEPTESIYGNLEMLNVKPSSPQAPPTKPHNFIGETTDLQEEDEYIPVVAQAYSTVNRPIRTSSGTLSSSSEEPKSRSNSLDQTSEDCRAKYNLPSLPKRLKVWSCVTECNEEIHIHVLGMFLKSGCGGAILMQTSTGDRPHPCVSTKHSYIVPIATQWWITYIESSAVHLFNINIQRHASVVD